jgi:hypothetical protein
MGWTIARNKLRKKMACALPLAAALLGLQASARANLLTNGDFSQTNLSTAGAILGAGSGTITGWNLCTNVQPYICPSGASTPNNGAHGLAFLYTPGTQAAQLTDTYGVNDFSLAQGTAPNTIPNSSPAGGNWLIADGGTSNNLAFYQTLTNLTSGAKYILTFYTAAGQQLNTVGATTEDWEVFFGTAGTTPVYTVQSTPTINNPQQGFTPWSLVTMVFTANSTSQVLEFLSQGTPSGDPPMDFLAGVSLTQAATPEPSAIALMGVGMIGLVVVRRKFLKRS